LYDSILVSLGISLISLPAAAQTATLISGLYGLSFLVHSFFIKSVPYLITGLVFTSFAAQVAKQAFTLKAANSYKNDLITHFAERMAKPIANRVVA
ncbi:MAG: hypothetical protein K9M13_03175, partial [Simkaniaceae bacterium]|nr:hypothetical protein [Simkaniaceae bacterium]